MRFYTFISTIVGASANSLFNPNCPRRNDTSPKPPPPPTETPQEPQQGEPEYPVNETPRSNESEQPVMQPDNEPNTPPPSKDSQTPGGGREAMGNVAGTRARRIRRGRV
ncbi:hypothetical protein FOL47_007592 [Perkinsus chesapeaki]|uniref:Uncharacterized protein n=1 Tax=Perkinsus chesapeaki TaxID=330153 RepID=A0A7J6LJW8_PERCH|nr:hypothetical protein FOL47_007592 [Perkinsus chesapeaki]